MARLSVVQQLIGWIFTHMSFVIPVQRLRETETLLAFHHPSPSYPVHILIIPKRALPGLADLTPGDTDFTVDLFAAVHSLVKEFNLEGQGYRLICNGGKYQDVPQLHFHLVSGVPPIQPTYTVVSGGS
jgi:histidine triad (HIT) family protein